VDWILLPALSLLTIGVLVCAVEISARMLFPESKTTTLSCLIVNDPSTGVRAIPNSACSQKIGEGELVTYRINSCGHRAGMECGAKSPGTFRIVMVGSSFNYGMWVPREKSFAALLPEELSRLTGRKVELYNEAMQWGTPHRVDLMFKEAAAAQPDLILWPVTPLDIARAEDVLPYIAPQAGVRTSPPMGLWQRVSFALKSKSPLQFVSDFWARITNELNGTRSVFLIQHAIFESQSQFVKQYLLQPESSDYLRSNESPALRAHLESFARYYADVQAQANSIGVPVVVVLLPERAQAAMISMKQWPEGFDPYKLGDEVRSIVTASGGIYLDVLPFFREIPNPERDYMPVDGHPNPDGHALLSGLLARALTDGGAPVLRAAR
jgi:hypothetical protein